MHVYVMYRKICVCSTVPATLKVAWTISWPLFGSGSSYWIPGDVPCFVITDCRHARSLNR